ncbi:MAG: DUF1232 domain-containing protein [Anaerolineae bacterium]|nr:DUF1232 domain-containing protein [Anaerolineae bacterium]
MPRARDHEDEYYDDEEDRGLPLSIDWGTKVGIAILVILTALYTLSPLDAIPDIIPVAGQVDDLVALVAGGGSVTFLAVLRYLLRSRAARWSCLVVSILSIIGATALFIVLAKLINSIS